MLFHKPNMPIAVIEAKDNKHSLGDGMQQGLGYAEMLQVLGAAFKASKRDEEGYASLSEVGQRAKAVSSFAVRNYGFTRLSDLIRSIPNFETRDGPDGRLMVKRSPAHWSGLSGFSPAVSG